jgi:glycosyltransferase involved in cell wall biosynthesis
MTVSIGNDAARPLTVLSVAYPFAPVSTDAVGGAEQVLQALDAALVAAGHRSVVVACEGSQTAGALIGVPYPAGRIDDAVRAATYARVGDAIRAALRRFPIDVIHMHGIDFHAYLPPPGMTVLVTVHLPPSWYPPEALAPRRPDTWLHGVSASQQSAFPPGTPLLPAIDNGVPTDRLPARHAKRGYALCLGRICPEKGFHLALEAARHAGRPLLLAGSVAPYPEHRRYFEEEVALRLDPVRRFLGPVGFARKRRLLSAARCLLVPSLAPETSSLVAMEALACGTPVIAFPAGALVEIVEHGRTGFLVADTCEMATAIERAGAIDPEVCRAAARDRFRLDRMQERYLARYRALLRIAA